MSKVWLNKSQEEVQKLVENEIEAGQQLLEHEGRESFRDAYLSWTSVVTTMLESCFGSAGFLQQTPKSAFSATTINSPELLLPIGAWDEETSTKANNDIKEKIRVLKDILKKLPFYDFPTDVSSLKSEIGEDAPIFLVHGRDNKQRDKVKRFLEQITSDRSVIVLANQPNKGNDILGKLLEAGRQSAFAVVLLTPDDEGSLIGQESMKRARQNVIFELGLFIGLLGRKNVAAIRHEDVEIPTDFSGIVYIPQSEGWEIGLARELQQAGIKVQMNNIL